MTIPARNHPGHALLEVSALPPGEALDAWSAQLMADLNSLRTTGVLIHSGFIGSDLQDNGVESIIEMLALALASMVDSTLSDNNSNERSRPIDEVMSEQFEQIREYLQRDLVPRLLDHLETKYWLALTQLEQDRRVQEAEDEEWLRQNPR